MTSPLSHRTPRRDYVSGLLNSPRQSFHALSPRAIAIDKSVSAINLQRQEKSPIPQPFASVSDVDNIRKKKYWLESDVKDILDLSRQLECKNAQLLLEIESYSSSKSYIRTLEDQQESLLNTIRGLQQIISDSQKKIIMLEGKNDELEDIIKKLSPPVSLNSWECELETIRNKIKSLVQDHHAVYCDNDPGNLIDDSIKLKKRITQCDVDKFLVFDAEMLAVKGALACSIMKEKTLPSGLEFIDNCEERLKDIVSVFSIEYDRVLRQNSRQIKDLRERVASFENAQVVVISRMKKKEYSAKWRAKTLVDQRRRSSISIQQPANPDNAFNDKNEKSSISVERIKELETDERKREQKLNQYQKDFERLKQENLLLKTERETLLTQSSTRISEAQKDAYQVALEQAKNEMKEKENKMNLEMQMLRQSYEMELRRVHEDSKESNAFRNLKEAFELISGSETNVDKAKFIENWYQAARILGLTDAWTALGTSVVPNDDDLITLFELLDVSKNSYIEFNEFLNVLSMYHEVLDLKQICIQFFNSLDRDNRGYVSKLQITQCAEDLCLKLNLGKLGSSDLDSLIGFCCEENGKIDIGSAVHGALTWAGIIKRGGILRSAFDIVKDHSTETTNVTLIRDKWSLFLSELGLREEIDPTDTLNLFVDMGNGDISFQSFNVAVSKWAARLQRSIRIKQSWYRVAGISETALPRTQVEGYFVDYAPILGLETTTSEERAHRFNSMRLIAADENKVTFDEFCSFMGRWMEQNILKNHLSNMFNIVDKQKCGSVRMSVLKGRILSIVTELNLQSVTCDELTGLFEVLDPDDDGVCQYQEFLDGTQDWIAFSELSDRLDRVFDLIDSDKSGSISLDEFLTNFPWYAQRIGINNVNRDSLRFHFDNLDKDHSNALSRDEFIVIGSVYHVYENVLRQENELFIKICRACNITSGRLSWKDFESSFNNFSSELGVRQQLGSGSLKQLFQSFSPDTEDACITMDRFHNVLKLSLQALSQSIVSRVDYSSGSGISTGSVLPDNLESVWKVININKSPTIGLTDLQLNRTVIATTLDIVNPFKFSVVALYKVLVTEFGNADTPDLIDRQSFSHLYDAYRIVSQKHVVSTDLRLDLCRSVFDDIAKLNPVGAPLEAVSVSYLREHMVEVTKQLHLETSSVKSWNSMFQTWDGINSDGYIRFDSFFNEIQKVS